MNNISPRRAFLVSRFGDSPGSSSDASGASPSQETATPPPGGGVFLGVTNSSPSPSPLSEASSTSSPEPDAAPDMERQITEVAPIRLLRAPQATDTEIMRGGEPEAAQPESPALPPRPAEEPLPAAADSSGTDSTVQTTASLPPTERMEPPTNFPLLPTPSLRPVSGSVSTVPEVKHTDLPMSPPYQRLAMLRKQTPDSNTDVERNTRTEHSPEAAPARRPHKHRASTTRQRRKPDRRPARSRTAKTEHRKAASRSKAAKLKKKQPMSKNNRRSEPVIPATPPTPVSDTSQSETDHDAVPRERRSRKHRSGHRTLKVLLVVVPVTVLLVLLCFLSAALFSPWFRDWCAVNPQIVTEMGADFCDEISVSLHAYRYLAEYKTGTQEMQLEHQAIGNLDDHDDSEWQLMISNQRKVPVTCLKHLWNSVVLDREGVPPISPAVRAKCDEMYATGSEMTRRNPSALPLAFAEEREVDEYPPPSFTTGRLHFLRQCHVTPLAFRQELAAWQTYTRAFHRDNLRGLVELRKCHEAQRKLSHRVQLQEDSVEAMAFQDLGRMQCPAKELWSQIYGQEVQDRLHTMEMRAQLAEQRVQNLTQELEILRERAAEVPNCVPLEKELLLTQSVRDSFNATVVSTRETLEQTRQLHDNCVQELSECTVRATEAVKSAEESQNAMQSYVQREKNCISANREAELNITSLQTQLQQCESRHSSLEARLTARETSLSESHETLRECEARVREGLECQGDLQLMQNKALDIETVREALKTAQNELKTCEAQYNEHLRDLPACQLRTKHLEKRVESERERLEDTQASLSQCRTRLEQCASARLAESDAAQGCETSLQQCLSDNTMCWSNTTHIRERWEAHNVTVMRAQLDSQSERLNLSHMLRQCESDLQIATHSLNATEHALTSSVARTDTLSGQLANKTARVTRLRTLVHRRNEQISNLTAVIEATRAGLKACMGLSETLEGQLTSSKSHFHEASTALAVAQEDAVTALHLEKTLRGELSECRGSLAAHISNCSARQTETESAHAAAILAERMLFNEKLENFTAHIQELARAERDATAASVQAQAEQAVSAKLAAAHARADRAEERAEFAEATHNTTKAWLEEAKESYTSAKEQIYDLQAQLTDTKDALQSAQDHPDCSDVQSSLAAHLDVLNGQLNGDCRNREENPLDSALSALQCKIETVNAELEALSGQLGKFGECAEHKSLVAVVACKAQAIRSRDGLTVQLEELESELAAVHSNSTCSDQETTAISRVACHISSLKERYEHLHSSKQELESQVTVVLSHVEDLTARVANATRIKEKLENAEEILQESDAEEPECDYEVSIDRVVCRVTHLVKAYNDMNQTFHTHQDKHQLHIAEHQTLADQHTSLTAAHQQLNASLLQCVADNTAVVKEYDQLTAELVGIRSTLADVNTVFAVLQNATQQTQTSLEESDQELSDCRMRLTRVETQLQTARDNEMQALDKSASKGQYHAEALSECRQNASSLLNMMEGMRDSFKETVDELETAVQVKDEELQAAQTACEESLETKSALCDKARQDWENAQKERETQANHTLQACQDSLTQATESLEAAQEHIQNVTDGCQERVSGAATECQANIAVMQAGCEQAIEAAKSQCTSTARECATATVSLENHGWEDQWVQALASQFANGVNLSTPGLPLWRTASFAAATQYSAANSIMCFVCKELRTDDRDSPARQQLCSRMFSQQACLRDLDSLAVVEPQNVHFSGDALLEGAVRAQCGWPWTNVNLCLQWKFNVQTSKMCVSDDWVQGLASVVTSLTLAGRYPSLAAITDEELRQQRGNYGTALAHQLAAVVSEGWVQTAQTTSNIRPRIDRAASLGIEKCPSGHAQLRQMGRQDATTVLPDSLFHDMRSALSHHMEWNEFVTLRERVCSTSDAVNGPLVTAMEWSQMMRSQEPLQPSGLYVGGGDVVSAWQALCELQTPLDCTVTVEKFADAPVTNTTAIDSPVVQNTSSPADASNISVEAPVEECVCLQECSEDVVDTFEPLQCEAGTDFSGELCGEDIYALATAHTDTPVDVQPDTHHENRTDDNPTTTDTAMNDSTHPTQPRKPRLRRSGSSSRGYKIPMVYRVGYLFAAVFVDMVLMRATVMVLRKRHVTMLWVLLAVLWVCVRTGSGAFGWGEWACASHTVNTDLGRESVSGATYTTLSDNFVAAPSYCSLLRQSASAGSRKGYTLLFALAVVDALYLIYYMFVRDADADDEDGDGCCRSGLEKPGSSADVFAY